MLIYLITHNQSSKKYIGQTTNSLEHRWIQHCRKSQSYCRLLHNALMKHGKENFTIKVLATAGSLEELNFLEEQLIKEYQTLSPNGYNLLSGGKNKKHHEESKRKMSITRTGKKIPALCGPRGPRPLSVGRNISLAKKGKTNSLKGTKYPYRPHYSSRKKIQAINCLTQEILIFDSVNEGAAHFKCTRPNIIACLKGRRPFAQKHTWKYL